MAAIRFGDASMKRVLGAVVFFALATWAPAAAPQLLDTPVDHVAIVDGASGTLLYCDDCRTPMPPASMSKLMTVLVVADRLRSGQLSMDTRFRVSERAWRHGAMSDGSHMFLELNSEVSVRDLLTGVIVVSANDACIVLAEGIAGSEEAFVAMMNRRAQELSLRSARFRNTTGLPDPDHVISAADLAALTRYVIATYPDIYRLYSQRSFTYNNRTQENRNPLLGAVEGADGVKTGHTSESGYGLVGSAVLNGQRRIVVFNGADSMAERRSEGIRLMRAAFHDFAVHRIAAAGEVVGEARVRLGGRRTVPLVARQDIYVGAPRAIVGGLRASIRYRGPMPAPVREDAVVAQLVVEGPGFETQRFDLVAGRTVGRANWFARAWEGLRLSLFGPS